MPDVIEATCKYTGGKELDGKFGPYTDAVFTYEGEEIKVFGNKDTDLFDALCNVEKGETYTIIDKDGSYKLADSEVARLTGDTQNGAPHPAEGQDELPEAVSTQELANEHARLIANTYAFLDRQFSEKGDAINQKPTPAEIQRMAVSAAIEAVR